MNDVAVFEFEREDAGGRIIGKYTSPHAYPAFMSRLSLFRPRPRLDRSGEGDRVVTLGLIAAAVHAAWRCCAPGWSCCAQDAQPAADRPAAGCGHPGAGRSPARSGRQPSVRSGRRSESGRRLLRGAAAGRSPRPVSVAEPGRWSSSRSCGGRCCGAMTGWPCCAWLCRWACAGGRAGRRSCRGARAVRLAAGPLRRPADPAASGHHRSCHRRGSGGPAGVRRHSRGVAREMPSPTHERVRARGQRNGRGHVPRGGAAQLSSAAPGFRSTRCFRSPWRCRPRPAAGSPRPWRRWLTRVRQRVALAGRARRAGGRSEVLRAGARGPCRSLPARC